jgi:glyoxylase-like metal-dependent hydrolase (beta-lactamase superfamily II)
MAERASNMKIGNVTVDAVLDGKFAIDRDIPYPGVPAERWMPYEGLLRNRRDVVNQLGGYLLRSDDYIALVDLGFGPTQVPNWESGAFLDSLAELGVTPDEVTDVIFTHLHFDHIGWAAVDGQPVFANATHRCHARDWKFFTGPDFADDPAMFGPGTGLEQWPDEMSTAARLRTIEPLVERFEGSTSLRPGLEVVEFPGHTPGTTAVRITSQGESGMLIGDIAHHQAELVEPDIHFIGDVAPDDASSSQSRLLAELADTGMPVAAAHFRDFQWGRVSRTGGAYTWAPWDEPAS